jgi:hypothetical protein
VLNRILHIILISFLLLGFNGCTTYNGKIKKTKTALLNNDYDKALHAIEKNKFLKRKRNQLLYHLEIGKIYHLTGMYDSSNYHLNIADNMMEEYAPLVDLATSTLVNPAMQNYRAAAHEKILVNYYKALNYLYLGKTDDALVEVRKLNLKEQALSVSVHGKEKKYYQDPFGLMLMGMIYESANDYNNAFIAYRNAYEVYVNSKLYKDKMPPTLEADIVRMAKLTGIQYNSDVSNPYQTKGEGGELILFWENGIAPVKEEKNMMFTINKANGKGAYYFTDINNTIQIPFNYNFNNSSNGVSASDIGLLRVASSFYVSTKQTLHRATLTVNGQMEPLFVGEDVEQLAFQLEKQNYLEQLGKRLLRVMVKKITELKVAQENEYAGLAVSIANLAMEKADTRNWQSLPNEIYFTRVPLKKGENSIKIQQNNGVIKSFKINGTGGMTFIDVASY